MAKHEQILLTDADCLPNSDTWGVKMLKNVCNNEDIVLGISHYFHKKGFLNFFIRYETLNTMLNYLTFALSGMPYMGVGRNLSYSKSTFFKSNGFDDIEGIVGGDDDLLIQKISKNNKVNICIEKDAICYSKPETKLLSYLKQKKRHLSVGKKYKQKFKVLLSLDLASNILFYVLFLFFMINDKLSTLLFIIFLCKLIISSIITYSAKIKTHAKISFLEIAVMDFLNSFITSILGMYSILAKNKRWN